MMKSFAVIQEGVEKTNAYTWGSRPRSGRGSLEDPMTEEDKKEEGQGRFCGGQDISTKLCSSKVSSNMAPRRSFAKEIPSGRGQI